MMSNKLLSVDLRYFVLIGMFVWNVGMLFWNVFNPMPLLLLSIMMALPTIMFFGIFISLDNESDLTNTGEKKVND
jgi:hypothetical protein